MNAFNEAAMGGQNGTVYRGQARVEYGNAPSRPVAQFWPVQKMNSGGRRREDGPNNSPSRNAFKNALYATLDHQVEGAISPYLFYDPPEFSDAAGMDYQSDWGSLDNIPYGAPSWDAHIAESTKENGDHEKKNDYGFAEGDEEVIKTALEAGLLEQLPKRHTYYSYGPGELIAISKKDFQLLDAIENNGAFSTEALNAVDINYRYAKTFAQAANDRYNKASAAVQGDFMEGTLDLGGKVGTSVIGIFGGPFANAAHDHRTAKLNAARYLAQLVSQHGEGTRVINTIDTQSDRKTLMADYHPTRRFEAFILGAFPRAVHEGIILNKNYDVFKNWKLVTEFDEAERAVKLIAQAKKKHTLTTEDRSFDIKKDEKFVFTLSHKWSEQDWAEIYKAAGMEELKFYGNGSRKLLVARATKEPDLGLL